jgi:hypothetical protein
VFIVITAKVTVEYVHYRGSIALVWTMAAAIAAAHVWKRWGTKAGAALAALLFVCAAVQAAHHREQLKAARATPTSSAHVIAWARQAAVPPDKTLYVPYYFVPVLHLYQPELRTAGYDSDWPLSRLTAEIRSPDAHGTFLCIQPVCAEVEAALEELPGTRTLVAPSHDGYPLYAVETRLLAASR